MNKREVCSGSEFKIKLKCDPQSPAWFYTPAASRKQTILPVGKPALLNAEPSINSGIYRHYRSNKLA